MGYAKIFSAITESSLWSESKDSRLLFVTLLAKADATGYVEASLPGIARAANLTMEETAAAMIVLESPDPHSKDLDTNPENEGRRVLKAPGGWILINYEDYRNRRSEEERRDYMRDYMRDYRKSRKQSVNNGKQNVNTVSRSKPPLAKAEAEAEAEEKGARAQSDAEKINGVSSKNPTIETIRGLAARNMIAQEIADAFFHAMEAVDWIDAKQRPIRKPESALIGWARNWNEIKAKNKNGNHAGHSGPGRKVDRNAGTLNDPSEYAGL